MGRLVEWAAAQGLRVSQTVSEVGSGMNGARPKLGRLLADGSVRCIAVEHRDRLARLGSEYIEAASMGAGRRLLVMESGEVEDDLVGDVTEVLT
jgi:putative resolvase